jgi:hypothetical protein
MFAQYPEVGGRPLVPRLQALLDAAAGRPFLREPCPGGFARRHVAFLAMSRGKAQIWIRDLDSLSARALPASEGGWFPFWSPDSRFIAFVAEDQEVGYRRGAGRPALRRSTFLQGCKLGPEQRDPIHPDPVPPALPRLRLRRIAGSSHRTGQGEPGNQPPLALVSSRWTSLSLRGANPRMCCKLQDEHSLFYSKSPIDGGFRAVPHAP